MHTIEQAGEDTILRIASAELAVEVRPFGAELHRLQDADGRDLLWDGDPAWWTGRAPILFPVIGVLNGGGYHLDGVFHAIPKHGFARHSQFDIAAIAPAMVALHLADSEATRALWPFPFALDIVFTVEGASLAIEAAVTNTGDAAMPASFGFHPAFRWPLPYGGDRADHRLRFSLPEPTPIRRVDPAGLLRPAPVPTPIVGDTLVPTDALFEQDAVILEAVDSRRVHYGVPGEPGLTVDFDLPTIAFWTKPGAPYLCIEPWQGIADPQGYAGDIRDKPGIVLIPPGDTRRFAIRITLTTLVDPL